MRVVHQQTKRVSSPVLVMASPAAAILRLCAHRDCGSLSASGTKFPGPRAPPGALRAQLEACRFEVRQRASVL